jgi:beta-xylosidase
MIKLESSTTELFDKGSYQGNWGDQGDGTYNNPVLAGDYSDPDIIRVGKDYFLISSTFQLSPGLVVLHSSDLINWTIINHAVRDLTQINPRFNWDNMDGYSRGIWAPCITYNKNNRTFFIHFGTPDEGFFMVKTTNPFGQWSDVYEVKKQDGSSFKFGWDDCTVLWDDDGQGYFIGTNFANNYKSWLFKLSEDGIMLQDDGVLVHCSNDEYDPLECVPEANKIFKRNGNYYFLHNGCYIIDGRHVRMAWIMKSSCIYGTHNDGSAGSFENPGKYEHIPFPIVEGYREPCQGNLIDAITPEGHKWYFFTHHGQNDVDGRPCSLLPIIWEDEWPLVMSEQSKGRMIWQDLKKPFPETARAVPDTSDDFDKSELGLQWMWNFQPRSDRWSLQERPGYLRLYAFKPLAADKIETAGNTLLQRNYRYEKNTAITKFDLSGMEEGQNSGMLHAAGSSFVSVGVSIEDGKRTIRFMTNEITEVICEMQPECNHIWFKSDWDFDYIHIFSYSFDGVNFAAAGGKTKLEGKDYRGDYIGFFNYNNKSDNGYVDIDYIHIEGICKG